MNNKVYYGEYSLKHWIDLMLKQNIILPRYQRYFVWNEDKIKTLITAFKNKQFIPTVTIGVFDEDDTKKNLILDGQQRLTSVLLAYLSLYPDPKTYSRAVEQFASDNNELIEVDEYLDNIMEWNFEELTKKGRTKEKILERIVSGNYKIVNFNIDENFLKNTFLGFSYLAPQNVNKEEQQRYYSSVFRNINIQGETLLPQESRAALYYLDENLKGFFDPAFLSGYTVGELKIDFVRFTSFLSQYKQDSNSQKIAKKYKQKLEVYYEEYIYSVIGENSSPLFIEFSSVFPDRNYANRLALLEETMLELDIPKSFTSIIDLDIYLFGLIYEIVFEGKTINVTQKTELTAEVIGTISSARGEQSHSRSPGAFRYLRERIEKSIAIYSAHVNE